MEDLMYQTGCNAYRQSVGNILEEKHVILLKLYDGALKFIAQARLGITQKSPKTRGESISKALAIIEELNCALDMERGGELAVHLDGLYKFVIDSLTSASLKNDLGALDAAKNVLETLKDGFEAAVRNQKGSQKRILVEPPQVEAGTRMAEGVRFAV